MHLHLLDFNGHAANQGIAALRGLMGNGVSVWPTRLTGVLPPADGGVWVLSGGPGSPLEDGPWRRPVLDALRARVRADEPTLAICYGFELLALALGAEVAPLARPRVGVVPLRLTGAGRSDPAFAGLDGAPTWENRQWGIFSGGGEIVAEGEEGDRVVARLGRNVLGVMFHPEADEAGVRAATVDTVLPGDPSGLDRVYASVVSGFLRAVRPGGAG